jgi:hypothetical protein
MVLLFGIPDAPLAGTPRRALDLVRANPLAGLREAGEAAAPRVRITVRPRWEEKKQDLAAAASAVAGRVARRSSGALDEWKTELGTLWERLASERATNDNGATAAEADRAGGESE